MSVVLTRMSQTRAAIRPKRAAPKRREGADVDDVFDVEDAVKKERENAVYKC
jgi:hypothetical protein